MGFCDLPLAGDVCRVGDAVDFATDPGKAIGNWMAKSAGDLAAASADLAAKAVNTTTNIDLNAPWFRNNYETLLPIGLVLLVATFCAQLVRAAMRRDSDALTRAVTGTVAGVLFAFSAIACTTIALTVVDALSDGLFHTAHLNIATAVRRLVQVSEINAISGLGWLVMAVAALGAAAGACLFWCVMMLRKVGILVLVTLAIFAGSGGGWEHARRWRRGWIEATATLVLSKLLMTVIFVLGIAAMGNTQAKDGIAAFADVMSGIIIMVLVLMCPFATFRFVHWASEGTDGESLHRAGGAGAQIVRQHAERAGRKAAAMAATGGTAAPQGPDAAGGDGFPGDIAANPTGASAGGKENPQGGGTGGSPSGDAITSGLEKAVQPAPTSVTDDTSGQVGGGWQSTPPSTTPPPQGAPPSSGSHNATTSGTAGPPPPPTGL